MKVKVEYNGQVLYVKKPGYKELSEAKLHSARVFNQARISNAMMKAQLWDYMRVQGIWNDDRQKELDSIVTFINESVTELDKGKNGKYKTLSDARKVALDIRVARVVQRNLLSQYTELEGLTIEGLSEQANFDYLMSLCIYNEDGSRKFSTVEEYFETSGDDIIRLCANELSYFVYNNLDKNWESKLPENKFLAKYKFVDDKLRLIDENGKFVNRDFKLVDEAGELIEKEAEAPKEDFLEFDNDLWQKNS
jgi:hypothetical protein